MYIISGCLLGVNCKYNGENNRCDWVCDFASKHSYLAVCPETAGGLLVPRPPAEIKDGRVINKTGEDVTAQFERGAINTFNVAATEAVLREEPLEGAILKARSPSCGCGKIYDGTFTGTLVDGDGVFAAELKRSCVKVMTEEDGPIE